MLKRETSSPVLLPTFSILNPELTETLPAYQTACGITDMYSHLLERYVSRSAAVGVSDRMIEGLMLSIIDEAAPVAEDPRGYDARANLMWAASPASIASTTGRATISSTPCRRAMAWRTGQDLPW